MFAKLGSWSHDRRKLVVGVWLALLVGALFGALAYMPWNLWSLLLPGAIYLAVLGLLFRRPV